MKKNYGINELLNNITKKRGVYGIFANPGFGTTTLFMQIADSIVKKTKGTIIVFSLGLSKEQWQQNMRSRGLSVNNVEVCDSAILSVNEIESAIADKNNVKLVIIDYIELLDGNVCQRLPHISRKYSVPILICGQLSRDSGDFDVNKTPELISVYSAHPTNNFLKIQQYDFLALMHRKHDCERGIGFAHRYNIDKSVELIVKVNKFGDLGRMFFKWNERRKLFKL